MVNNLPVMEETQVWSLGWEDPLEKGMATDSSILAWNIPWMEETGGLQFMGVSKSQTRLSDYGFCSSAICGLCVWSKDRHSSSLVTQPLGLNFDFGSSSACGPPWVSVPCPGEKEWKQQLMGAHLLAQARRNKAATAGVCVKCPQWQRRTGSCNRLRRTLSGANPCHDPGGCVDWGGLGLRCGWACSDRGLSRCLWRQGAAGREGIAVVSLTLRPWHLASRASWASSENFPGWGASSCRPVRLPLHSRQLSSRWVCSPNPTSQGSVPLCAKRHTTQPGACRTAALTPRVVLPLPCPPQTSCCVPLWPPGAPVLLQLVSLQRGFSKCRDFFSPSATCRGWWSLPIFSFFPFFCLTRLCGDFLVPLGVSGLPSASVQLLICENSSVCRCTLDVLVSRSKFCFLLFYPILSSLD